MRRTKALLFDFVTLASLLSVSACSSKGGSTAAADGGSPYGPCVAFVSVSDLSAPVSFSANVAPIFQSNCTSGDINCHGATNNVPYLGSSDGGADIATMFASIVGVTSPEDPAMDLVTPGNPGQSYLMHKLDGDQCTLSAECMTTKFKDYLPNCGNDMPNGAAMLPLPVRDSVRAWIQQGANDN